MLFFLTFEQPENRNIDRKIDIRIFIRFFLFCITGNGKYMVSCDGLGY
jgi:hypothetical protein